MTEQELTEIEGKYADRSWLGDEVMAVCAEVRRLQALVQQAEWADTSGMDAYCPWCQGREGDGHTPTCPAFPPQRSDP